VTRAVTGGVDTHAGTHVAAALDSIGGLLGVQEFPATAAGYARLLDWLGGFATVCLVGIEGTGCYGAGLARHVSAAGVRVVEVDRSDRQDRRRQGKSDPLDAVSAARAAQSGQARGASKGRDGAVEAIRAHKDYLVSRAARAAPDRVCVEFRNHTWMTGHNRGETLDFPSAHQLPYVCVDMPQGYPSSIPPVLAATTDLAVVRFHGHSDKWDSHNTYERFGYHYELKELTGWSPEIRDLAGHAETTHVLFNNCYRDYAQTNAQQLATLLSQA
jgi:Protein of unknown function DUF72/Transposase